MTRGYIKSIRRFSRNAKLYLMVSGGVSFCFFGIYAILYNLFLLRVGYGPVYIGLANGIVGLGYAVCSLPAGVLGGKFGYRRIMIVGVAICAGAASLLPVALALSGAIRSIWLVFMYGLYGTAGALVLVNGVPFLMASSSDDQRDHLFAIAVAVPAVAGFVGSIVGGLLPQFFALVSKRSLQEAHPFAYSLWLVPIVYGLMIVALRATTPVSTIDAQTRAKRAGRTPYHLVVLCSIVVLLRVGIFFAATAFLNVYMDTLFQARPSTIGALAAIGRLAAVPGALLSPLLVSKWGRHRTIVILFALLFVSSLPISFSVRISAIAVSLVAIAAATSALDAVFGVYSQKITTPEHRGAMSGAIALGAGGGYAFTMYGGGYVIERLGFRPLFLLCCAMVIASALVFILFFSLDKSRALRAQANG